MNKKRFIELLDKYRIILYIIFIVSALYLMYISLGYWLRNTPEMRRQLDPWNSEELEPGSQIIQ